MSVAGAAWGAQCYWNINSSEMLEEKYEKKHETNCQICGKTIPTNGITGEDEVLCAEWHEEICIEATCKKTSDNEIGARVTLG